MNRKEQRRVHHNRQRQPTARLTPRVRVFCVSRAAPIAALVDARKRTTVSVDAVAFDYRMSGAGCSPDGCVPENTRDNSRAANSRWSCKVNIIEGNGGCRIDYHFEDPQDIKRMRIAFHKGDENTRALNVFVDGEFHSLIESSGTTLGYQNFLLNTQGTSDIRLYHDDFGSRPDEWLSITEV